MTRIVRLGKLSCAFAAPKTMTRPNNAPAVLPRRLVITPRALPCWWRFRRAMGSQDAGIRLSEQEFASASIRSLEHQWRPSRYGHRRHPDDDAAKADPYRGRQALAQKQN